MKRTVKLTGKELKKMISESVKRVLKESVGRRKEIHELPRISVKQATKYRGNDPKGISYNVYVDGAKMFTAVLTGSEHTHWSSAYHQKGAYSEIWIKFINYSSPTANTKFKNDRAFRQQIGFNNYSDFNGKQAKENVHQILPDVQFSLSRESIYMEDYDTFTPENAPYIIQKCVEGLITPQKNRRKPTDEITIEDIYDGSEKTMTVQDAYDYALTAYEDITGYIYRNGPNIEVNKPNEYESIEDCLWSYADILREIHKNSEHEREDWYERNEHGDFDSY